MQKGKYKENCYAVCFCEKQEPKKNDEGNVIMKEGKPVMEWVRRGQELCAWGKTEADAKKYLTEAMEKKDLRIDKTRTTAEQCPVHKVVAGRKARDTQTAKEAEERAASTKRREEYRKEAGEESKEDKG